MMRRIRLRMLAGCAAWLGLCWLLAGAPGRAGEHAAAPLPTTVSDEPAARETGEAAAIPSAGGWELWPSREDPGAPFARLHGRASTRHREGPARLELYCLSLRGAHARLIFSAGALGVDAVGPRHLIVGGWRRERAIGRGFAIDDAYAVEFRPARPGLLALSADLPAPRELAFELAAGVGRAGRVRLAFDVPAADHRALRSLLAPCLNGPQV